MAYAKLSPAIASAINLARQHAGDDDRKAVKKEMFAAAKAQFGIPDDIKVKCETSDTASAVYLVLKDSRTGQPFTLGNDGRWVDALPQQVQVQPRVTRWFKITKADLIEAAKDAVVADGTDWDENVTPYGDAHFDGLRADYDGNVYVEMTEDELI